MRQGSRLRTALRNGPLGTMRFNPECTRMNTNEDKAHGPLIRLVDQSPMGALVRRRAGPVIAGSIRADSCPLVVSDCMDPALGSFGRNPFPATPYACWRLARVLPKSSSPSMRARPRLAVSVSARMNSPRAFSPWPTPVERSAMLPRLQLLTNFIVVAEEPHFHGVIQIQKQKTKFPVAAALEQVLAKFADADAAVDVRSAESPGQLQQGIPAFVPVAPSQCSQPREDPGVNDQRLFHASS